MATTIRPEMVMTGAPGRSARETMPQQDVLVDERPTRALSRRDLVRGAALTVAGAVVWAAAVTSARIAPRVHDLEGVTIRAVADFEQRRLRSVQ